MLSTLILFLLIAIPLILLFGFWVWLLRLVIAFGTAVGRCPICYLAKCDYHDCCHRRSSKHLEHGFLDFRSF